MAAQIQQPGEREWERTAHLGAAKGSSEQAQGEFSHFGKENPKSCTQKTLCSTLFLLGAPENPLGSDVMWSGPS